MPWFKVDDKLHDHRKARKAGKSAMGVWALSGSWCMDHLTDGFVPESVLVRWGNRRDANALVAANLWENATKDGEEGWQFRNWTEFQPSKEEVESERKATKDRVRKWRESKRGNAVTQPVTNGDVTAEVQAPRPDPTRPDPSKRVAGKRATALPDDWRPTEAHRSLALERGVDPVEEYAKFRDWSISTGSTKKDWDATFRNWIRNARPTSNVRPIRTDDQGRPILPPLPGKSPWSAS